VTTYGTGIILRPQGTAYAEQETLMPLLLLRLRAALRRDQVVPCGKPSIRYIPAHKLGTDLLIELLPGGEPCYGITLDIPVLPPPQT